MKLVLIPPGEFEMGSTQEEVAQLVIEAKQNNYAEWYAPVVPMQAPRHRVRLTKPFYLGACEVTAGAFRRFVDDTGYKTDAEKDGKGGFGDDMKGHWVQKPEFVWRNPDFTPTDMHPVVHVSWNDATAFCQWLGRTDGKGYRLATDAEWEYACRAGSAGRFSFGDDATRLGEYAWHFGNAGQRVHPVGEKQPNAWGLHDMHGSVREWCADWFAPDYYAKSPSEDPVGPDSGEWRVIRGNVWNDIPNLFRCAYRQCNAPQYRDVNIGFRVAWTIPVKAPATEDKREPAAASQPSANSQKQVAAAQAIFRLGGSVKLVGSDVKIAKPEQLPPQAFQITQVAVNGKLTERDLDALAGISTLKRADLIGAPDQKDKAGDGLITRLSASQDLRELNLFHVLVTGNGLRRIVKDFQKLSALSVYGTLLSDEDLRELNGLKELRFLCISGNAKITDRGIHYVGEMRQMEYVHMQFLPLVTDAGFLELANLKALKVVGIDRRISEKAIAELKKELPDCHIGIGGLAATSGPEKGGDATAPAPAGRVARPEK
jgi:formylglycine-generating enzyme required for sulfatase activity